MRRDLLTSHIFSKSLLERELFHDLRVLDNEDTFINATIVSFRWVLNNEEGSSSKDAYKNSWLRIIYENDSKNDSKIDRTSIDNCSFASEESQKIESSVDDFMNLKV